MKKSLLICLALFLILAGCGKKNPDLDSSKAIAEQKKFEEYLNDAWITELSTSKLSAHYLVADLSAYGLEDMEVSMGHADGPDFEVIKEAKTKLENIDRSLLTDHQKNYYDRFLTFLNLGLQYEGLMDYEFVFTPNDGINNDLITIFTEFELREEQDIQDVIVYLQQSRDYIQECFDYTTKQVDKGIVQSDITIEAIIDQCNRFLSGNPNGVEKVLCTRIDKFDGISDSLKADYQAQVKQAVKDYLIPAYQDIVAYFTKLKGTATNNGAYANWEDGKKYYELRLKEKTSTNLSVKEIEKQLEEAIEDGLNDMTQIVMKNEISFDDLFAPVYDSSDANEILNHLQQQIKENYPEITNVTYTVDYLDPTVVSDAIAAYYLIPPVDRKQENVIRVNPVVTDLFNTLAHEGYPGHLYQTNYFMNHNFHPINNVMNYIGYAEGWAVYVEMDSYNMGDVTNESLIELLQINSYLSYWLVCLVDIMVNYNGATLEEVNDYLTPFGMDGEYIYELVLQDPGLYLPYGFGYLKMSELRERAESKLKDQFVAKEFHEVILNTGPCSYEYLSDRVDEYIKSKK
ncbi:MAG: DUF885 domain-containing protein [Erysipelotrichaceae bacterium]|nr:DUF885 domain-containing protein [Erysipelotrichaceae bacterium]